jgi:hypothetical protein
MRADEGRHHRHQPSNPDRDAKADETLHDHLAGQSPHHRDTPNASSETKGVVPVRMAIAARRSYKGAESTAALATG